MTPEGLITVQSRAGPTETVKRLVAAITSREMAVMARIDHAAAAEKAGLKLGPTEVLLFGNPAAGTPLMQARQTAGIDLPLKALVWQDESGQTFIGYNDPHWIAARHALATDAGVAKMATVLAAVVGEAADVQGESP